MVFRFDSTGTYGGDHKRRYVGRLFLNINTIQFIQYYHRMIYVRIRYTFQIQKCGGSLHIWISRCSTNVLLYDIILFNCTL